METWNSSGIFYRACATERAVFPQTRVEVNCISCDPKKSDCSRQVDATRESCRFSRT